MYAAAPISQHFSFFLCSKNTSNWPNGKGEISLRAHGATLFPFHISNRRSSPSTAGVMLQMRFLWYIKKDASIFIGSRAKLLPYTNFYVEVLTNFRIKLLHIEVLAIFRDKTSTLTKLIKKSSSPPGILKSPTIKTGFKILKTSSVQPVSVHLFEVVI